MDRWSCKTAVVTGASSGIGAACVRALLKANVNVIGLSRRVHLVEVCSRRVLVITNKITFPYSTRT